MEENGKERKIGGKERGRKFRRKFFNACVSTGAYCYLRVRAFPTSILVAIHSNCCSCFVTRLTVASHTL